jgi:hypothetical protein
MTGSGIMATTWETITVRVQRPPEIPLGEFFGDMRIWLDHHRVMLANFNGVTLANKSGVFEAQFDNPRDALLFKRRFAAQPTNIVPVRMASRESIIAAAASGDRSSVSIRAAIAGMVRSVWPKPTPPPLSPLTLDPQPAGASLDVPAGPYAEGRA